MKIPWGRKHKLANSEPERSGLVAEETVGKEWRESFTPSAHQFLKPLFEALLICCLLATTGEQSHTSTIPCPLTWALRLLLFTQQSLSCPHLSLNMLLFSGRWEWLLFHKRLTWILSFTICCHKKEQVPPILFKIKLTVHIPFLPTNILL